MQLSENQVKIQPPHQAKMNHGEVISVQEEKQGILRNIDFDVIMAGIDIDMLQIDEELNLEISPCVKNMLPKIKLSI